MYMTTLISKLLPFFCHEWQRVSTSSRHLIIIGRASTIILISIITVGAIITLILKSRWRWRRNNSETTHVGLSLCNTTNTGVHLTQLITKCVKVSIHAHKLCHDGLKSHSTHRSRRSEGGWSGRRWRSRHLYLGPPWPKLCLAPSDNSSIYGTHNHEVMRLGKGDRKMVKDSRDSQRKNELIMGHRIPIDNYKG